jgi:hypothetical protein
MDNKGKWKSFQRSDTINILEQVESHIGTYVELGIMLETLCAC